MKTVLGLDVGVNSVGFALVKLDAEGKESGILRSGVRIVSEDPDFHGNFYSGASASKNLERRQKRSIRRGYKRYQLRKDLLYAVLKQHSMMPDEDLLERLTALELYELRVKALTQQLSLQELGRVFIALNVKRGFLSNRKSASEEETKSEYLKRIEELKEAVKDSTIGAYFYEQLSLNPFAKIKENIFPRAEYIREFDLIWKAQKRYYPEKLSGGPGEVNQGTLYQKIRNEIIYFQRPLKSQKGLINKCRFEPSKRVIPKSHPLFQVFRIWQQINNLEVKDTHNQTHPLDIETKHRIFDALHDISLLNSKGYLTEKAIFKQLQLKAGYYYLNYDHLEGNKTFFILHRALREAGIEKPEKFLDFNADVHAERGGLEQLWHVTYSLSTEAEVVHTLIKHFNFTKEQATLIAKKVGYTSDFGSLSAKAIRKVLPHLQSGLHYDKACANEGYNHVDDIQLNPDRKLLNKMRSVKPNELRNPVVEQVLNQVANVVNSLIAEYGKPEEVRVELARELRNNAKKRSRLTQLNKQQKRKNDEIEEVLTKENSFKRVNGRDLLRYRLWDETERICLYSGKPIPFADVYNGATEIEHILPKSRSFSNSMSNFIVVYKSENSAKDQMTAYDYMKSKGDARLAKYVEKVNELFERKLITKAKKTNLLCSGEDIPNDFIDRQKNDTQYIAREAVGRLKEVFPKVYTTSGSVTDFLRDKWKLTHVMKEVNLDKYRALGLTEKEIIKDQQGLDKEIEVIKDWSKRDDHRHHAVDALIIAFTNQSIIQKLNTLNQQYALYKDLKESPLNFPEPIPELRRTVKEALDSMLISFKKPNAKVLSRKTNTIKTKEGKKEQVTWVPRGALHEDTIMGKIRQYEKVPLNKKFDRVEDVVSEGLKQVLKERLAQFNNDPAQAFAKLDTNPVVYGGIRIEQVVVWKYSYSKRIPLTENLTPAQVKKIIDPAIRRLVEDRIASAGSIKAAFKEYSAKPLYLDAAHRLPIKSVSVFDEGNLQKVREGYVYLKGNHHAIIYTDGQGNFKDKVVSFWEAVEGALHNLRETGSIYPLINTSPDEEGWQVYTTLQINDLFVIGLDPEEVDFFNPANRSLVAKHLFRLQTVSKGDYRFRHQYETTLNRETTFAFRRIQSMKYFNGIYKVRLNSIGQIISVGKENQMGT